MNAQHTLPYRVHLIIYAMPSGERLNVGSMLLLASGSYEPCEDMRRLYLQEGERALSPAQRDALESMRLAYGPAFGELATDVSVVFV